jgi:hypothetical protein
LGDSFRVADMSMSWACLLNSASNVCRKGLRDIGRLPALVGVLRAGEERAGEAARLRNGLLEDSSRERPGEGRRSRLRSISQWDSFSSPPTDVKRAIKELTWH